MKDLENSSTPPVRRVPVNRTTPLPNLSPGDLAWESDLLLLLSNLESLRVRYTDYCRRGRAVAALESMLSLMQQVVDFSAQHFDPAHEMLVELQARADAFRTAVTILLERLNRSTLQTLLRMFRRTPSAGDPHAQFVGCAQALVEVLAAYFGFFRSCFRLPAAAAAWEETSGVFLDELRALVALLES
jgi:hypothetical protein